MQPIYSAAITERKIVGAVISVNFYYCLIGEKKGRRESAVIPGCAVITLAVIYGLNCFSFFVKVGLYWNESMIVFKYSPKIFTVYTTYIDIASIDFFLISTCFIKFFPFFLSIIAVLYIDNFSLLFSYIDTSTSIAPR